MELSVLSVVVISTLILALFVLLKNPKSATNRLFALLTGLIALWSIIMYVSLHPPSIESALFWIRSTIFVATPMSVTFFLFIHNFPNVNMKISKGFLYPLIGFTILTMIVAQSQYLFTSLKVSGTDLQTSVGPGMLLFVIINFGSIIGSIIVLARRYLKSTGQQKEQIKYLLFGISLMFILILFFIFVPVVFLQKSAFVLLGPLFMLVFLASTSYAIVKHRLMDIRLVVARAVAYTILVVIIGVSYITSAFFATSVLFKTSNTLQQIGLYAILTLVVAFTFQPLRNFLEKTTDKFFFKGRYDSQILLSNLTKIMATTLGLRKVTEKLLVELLPEMRISKGTFILIDKGKITNVENAGFDNEKYISTDILSLLETEELLFYDDLANKKLKKILADLDATVSVPLKVKENELGILLLGHKLSGEIYTSQDIKLLEILSPEISIAIQNSKAYEEIRRFNIKLAGEVEKATSDLVQANEKLKELDKLKDEFMSIASHELRTPMTAIKSYVWLALHGKSQEKDKKVRAYLDKVFESSERMINMINDMLNVNRIETGRMKLDIIPVSVWKVAEQVKDELSARAAESGLEIVIKKDTIVPLLMSDKDKLIEIFTNLIGNALKFTPKGGKITVAARKAGTMVEVQVSDTGVGIAKENIDKLFKKYGKLNDSYATVSPSTGTGLGLYITRQYLEKMGGKIGIASTLGKGTTFTFSLPIAAGKDLLLHEREEVQPSGVILNPKLAKDPKFLKAVVKAETSRPTKQKT